VFMLGLGGALLRVILWARELLAGGGLALGIGKAMTLTGVDLFLMATATPLGWAPGFPAGGFAAFEDLGGGLAVVALSGGLGAGELLRPGLSLVFGLGLVLGLGPGLGILLPRLLCVTGLRLLPKPLLMIGLGLLLRRCWGGGFVAALPGNGLLPGPGTTNLAPPVAGGDLAVDCLP
jgi:hypothetical protein